MPRKKAEKLFKNEKQAVLSTIFILVLIGGFVGVWYVDAYYEDGNSTLLFESDSNTEFGSYNFVGNPTYFPSLKTCQRISTNYLQYNRTPAYIGNNTYLISLNDTNANFNSGYIVIDMPNLDSWIIDKIIVNSTENDDPSYRFISSFISSPLPAWNLDKNVGVSVIDFYGAGGNNWINTTETVSLTEGLEIYQNAQGTQSILAIQFYDDGADWNGFAWEFHIEIYGEKITGWSKLDATNLVIASCGTINIIVGIFMTDQIDVGGYVKDLQKRRK